MAYWDILGRVLVEENQKEYADSLADFLNDLGISASVSASPESGLFAVTVPLSQKEEAEKAVRRFYAQKARMENRKANTDTYRSQCLSPQPTFVPSEEKFRTNTKSSLFFLLCGSLVFVLAVFHFFLIAYHREDGDIQSCIFEILMGTLFVLFGINTHQKVRILQQKMMEENAFTDQIIRWCTDTYSADHIDKCIEAEGNEEPLNETQRSAKRRELIEDYILREYDIRDLAYLTYVTDSIYRKLYFPNGISGVAG